MSPIVVGILGIALMIGIIFLGMNIGLAMFFIGFLGFAYMTSFDTAMGVMRTVPYTNASSYSLSVVPLFVLMGMFAYDSGMSSGLFDASDKWLSKTRGGLSMATIAACGGFGAICGASAATAVTFATIAMPEMRKYKYHDGLSSASVAAGGTLSYLIPPSTGFILYGIIAEESIGRLFAAGVIPGILLMLAYCVAVMIICRIRPEYAPPVQGYPLSVKIRALKGLIPVLLLFIAVIGGMFSGVFSANEAAAAGAFLAMVFTALRRRLTWRSLWNCLIETTKSTAMVFTMLLGAYVFGYFLTITRLPVQLADFVSGLNVSPFVVMTLIILLYAFLGCIMDGLSIILLTVPIFLPIILNLGYSKIHFGVIIAMVMVLGAITPPIGINIFVVVGAVKDLTLPVIYRGIVPFCLTLLIMTLVIAAFPILSTWLPTLLYG